MAEANIHIDSDDELTLPQDVASLSESDDRRMSQRRQLIPRKWISANEWIQYVQAHLHVAFGPQSAVPTSIFTVLNSLKDTKREAYVPRRFSLGPYHHGSAELLSMDHHKGRALCRMSKMWMSKMNIECNKNMDFPNRAMEEILKLENEIRHSYEESIDCNGKTLARMLSLDGCFLLELLRSLGGDVAWEWKTMFSASDAVKDILMLENQIPFIVLLKLLELESDTAVGVEEKLSKVLVNVTWGWFEDFDDPIEWWRVPVKELPHLLGFLYRVVVSPPISHPRYGLAGDERTLRKARNGVPRIRPAVELRNAGIKFKPCYGGIQDIRFDRRSATIFLPRIHITDITEVLFRNLIAFEMCQPLEINYMVSDYVNLMDNLIDSEKDVALLIRMGVLGNWVGGDKEVVDLFKGLRKAAPVNLLDVFDQLTEKVNDHYENQIRVQLQFPELVQDYFSSPWKALASVAAIVLLLLTLVQTIFSIISVYKK